MVKNEITAHAVAALQQNRRVATIVEIGGQDSKLIVLRDGVVVDFAMNTVCAAGTGSFLDQQAVRLSIPIGEFGELALHSKNPVRIAGALHCLCRIGHDSQTAVGARHGGYCGGPLQGHGAQLFE